MNQHPILRKMQLMIAPVPNDTAVSKMLPSTGDSHGYKRYILFGHQRCGSSVLTSGMKSNPNIKAFAELFTPNHITFNYPGYDNHSISLMKLRDSEPVRFLEEVVFCGQNDNVEAVGFKVFPDQIDRPKFEPVWQWIADNDDVALIMLNRENALKTLCSVQIAKKTGVWGIKDEKKRPTLTITLTPKQCEEFFEKRAAYAQMVRERFKGRDIFEITYETFAENIPKYFSAVQDYIGIESTPLPVNDVKKEIRTLDEIIVNYDELKDHFKNTRWESYFE